MDFLVMLGPPGAGKGTVCRILTERLGMRHISTGDAIRREMADPKSDFGERARPYMDRGDYVPDEMALELFFHILEGADPDTRWVFDGFPRTVPQAGRFSRWAERHGGRIRACVALQLDVDVAIERMQQRLICSECQAVYHRLNRPPALEGICDQCSGVLTTREDDSPELIASRMNRFEERTRPLLDWFDEQGLLWEFDAAQEPDSIADSIRLNLERAPGA